MTPKQYKDASAALDELTLKGFSSTGFNTTLSTDFDKDSGKTAAEKYFDKLKRIADKYKNYCKFSFIYDTKGLLDLKDSPVDKGETVFRQLLNSRVKFYNLQQWELLLNLIQ